jgi:hypothetical protein
MEDFHHRNSPSPDSDQSESTPRSSTSDNGKNRRSSISPMLPVLLTNKAPPKKPKPVAIKSHSVPGKPVNEHESELVKINPEKKKRSGLPVINGR